MIHPLECTELMNPINTAVSFFCVSLVWWDGAGVDAVSWWESATHYVTRLVLATGEVSTKTEPRVLVKELVN